MAVILILQCLIVVTLVVTSRRGLENALPFLCFFLVLMPLESRLVIPGLFDFNTMRLSLITMLILYFAKGGASSPAPVPLKGLMLMHIGWALLSTLFSLSVATSAKQVLSQVLEYYLMYYLLVKTITRVDTLYKIIYAVVMAMGLCCIFSLFEAYASWSILRIFPSNLWITYNGGSDPLYIEWGRGLRVRSTFPHPILFGDALAMSIPLALYLLNIWERGKQRMLLWLALVLMFWAIYKTSSRGPWIDTCISAILLFVMIGGRLRKYLLTLVVIGIVVVIARPGIWQTIDNLYEVSTDTNNPVGTSYLYRHVLDETVKAAVRKDTVRALLGYGLGTFREIGLQITFQGVTQVWHTCDDNWADFLYETGYVGLLIIGVLLLRPLWGAFRNYWSLPRPEDKLSGVLFICLLGFDFSLMSVAGYSWGQQGYMNWIIISMSIALPRAVYSQGSLGNLEEESVHPIEEEHGVCIA
jgi:O-antigen ligase